MKGVGVKGAKGRGGEKHETPTGVGPVRVRA